MKTIKQMLITVAVLLFSVTVHAFDFEVDGIYYDIISAADLTVEVMSGDSKYSGEVVIPFTVTYKSKVLTVTAIGNDAFSNCDSLTYITIPKSVTSIGHQAFYKCSSLTSINIPENSQLTSIGSSAFYGCSSLTAINIPEGVTSIRNYAFDGCTSLKEVIIEDGSTTLSLGYNNHSHAYRGGQGLFYDCPLDTVYLGRNLSYNSLEEYGYSPFSETKLTSLVIGDSVTSIGECAFQACYRLATVTIGKNVTKIEYGAFRYCNDSLTSITIPEGVTSIGQYAFHNCYRLATVTIGKNVTKIEYGALEGCHLTSIYLMGGNPPSVGSDNFDDVDYTNITIYVPQGTLSVYQAADVWGNFWDIQEHDIPVDPNVEVKKCATPTISYEDGKLNITSETEGVEFVTEITNSDITKHYTSMIELAVTYNVSTYAKLSGYENSDVTYATLCWIESDNAGSDLTQIKSTPVLIKSNEGSISINGVKADTEITVYDISGNKVSATVANGDEVVINTSLSKNETAIIHIGNKAIKIIMR